MAWVKKVPANIHYNTIISKIVTQFVLGETNIITEKKAYTF